MIPLMGPGILTAGIFVFLFAFQEYLTAAVLTDATSDGAGLHRHTARPEPAAAAAGLGRDRAADPAGDRDRLHRPEVPGRRARLGGGQGVTRSSRWSCCRASGCSAGAVVAAGRPAGPSARCSRPDPGRLGGPAPRRAAAAVRPGRAVARRDRGDGPRAARPGTGHPALPDVHQPVRADPRRSTRPGPPSARRWPRRRPGAAARPAAGARSPAAPTRTPSRWRWPTTSAPTPTPISCACRPPASTNARAGPRPVPDPRGRRPRGPPLPGRPPRGDRRPRPRRRLVVLEDAAHLSPWSSPRGCSAHLRRWLAAA